MRVLNWNLEKRDLVKWAMDTFNPDVALFQEHWESEVEPARVSPKYSWVMSESYKKKGSPCGTACYSKLKFDEYLALKTKQKEFLISPRKTMCAIKIDGTWFVSIHAYNGWPFKSVSKLEMCVLEFVEKIPRLDNAVLCGDFNTWTAEHQGAVNFVTSRFGFIKQFSIPYDPKKTMDHVYARGCRAKLITTGHELSDHPYLLFDVW